MVPKRRPFYSTNNVLFFLAVITVCLCFLNFTTNTHERYSYLIHDFEYHPEETSAQDGIRVIIQVFYENRLRFVKQLIQEYRKYGTNFHFILVWNNIHLIVPKWCRSSTDVEVLLLAKNSLNNRWLVDLGSYEGLVIAHDDDLALKEDAIMTVISEFEANPGGFYSPFVRFLSEESYVTSKFEPGNLYNMGLAIFAFHSKLLNAYKELPEDVLSFVDIDEGHCDDVLFNIVAQNFTKSSVKFVQLKPTSVHDFHKHSYKGSHTDNTGISLTKSPFSRKHVRIRCYKTYRIFFGTDPLKFSEEIPTRFDVHVYGSNTNLEHPCGKMVFGTFFSNGSKKLSRNEKRLDDAYIKGYSQPFASNVDPKALKLVKDKIYAWKQSLHNIFENDHNWEEVYGKGTLLNSRCFLTDIECTNFAKNRVFSDRLEEHYLSTQPLAILSLDIFGSKSLNHWQTSIDNFNRAKGEIYCFYTNVGATSLFVEVLTESHLYPSIWSLFDMDLLKNDDDHEYQSRLLNKIQICASELEIMKTGYSKLKLKPGDSILLSNEIWYRIKVDHDDIIKSCYTPVQEVLNSDLSVRYSETLIEYIPGETIPMLPPIAFINQPRTKLSLNALLNYNLDITLEDFEIEKRQVAQYDTGTSDLHYANSKYSLISFEIDSTYSQKGYMSNVEGIFSLPNYIRTKPLLAIVLQGSITFTLERGSTAHDNARVFKLSEFSSVILPANKLQLLKLGKASSLLLLEIEKTSNLQMFNKDPGEKPSLRETVLKTKDFEVRMGVCAEKYLGDQNALSFMLFFDIKQPVILNNMIIEDYEKILRIFTKTNSLIEMAGSLRSPFCYVLM